MNRLKGLGVWLEILIFLLLLLRRKVPCYPSEGLEFLNFMSTAGVFDAGFLGSTFTWCNNRHGHARIWKHLDFLLINIECSDFSSVSVSHLARQSFDHTPILITFFFISAG